MQMRKSVSRRCPGCRTSAESFIRPYVEARLSGVAGQSDAEDDQVDKTEGSILSKIRPPDIKAVREQTPNWRRFGWDSPLLCAVEAWLRVDGEAAWAHQQPSRWVSNNDTERCWNSASLTRSNV